MHPRDGAGQAEDPSNPEDTLMTTRWPRILLTLLCVLASAATADAECAWVLWEVSRPQPTWEIKGAYESISRCSNEREAIIRAVLAVTKSEAFREIKRAGDTVFFDPKVGAGWGTEYLCLPDTVDPRGPKGK
jgi:hypothetical protein